MASSNTRQRRRERTDRQRQRKRQQRDSALPVFKAVGIDAAVRQMDPRLREHIYRLPRLKFRPALAPEAAKLPNCLLLADRLRELADQTKVDLPNGAQVSLSDFWAVLMPAQALFRAMVNDGTIPPHLHGTFQPLLDVPIVELSQTGGAPFGNNLGFYTHFHSCVDESICWVEIRDLRSPWIGKEFVIHAEPARRRDFVLPGGDRRPAYQVAGWFPDRQPSGVYWAQWQPEVVGLPAGGPPLPVYIQRHALHRLLERLNVLDPWVAHLAMTLSLSDPKIQHRPDDSSIWIECQAPGGSIGYFVARVVDGCILVRSFLFLTMEGTREHRALSRELKLQQRDLSYLRLDELKTFVHSDLLDDPVLVHIFRKCGLGHLLEVKKNFPPIDGPASAQADFVRKYLNMPARRPAAAAATAPAPSAAVAA